MANKDNPRKGSDFESVAQGVFAARNLTLVRNFTVDVGVGQHKHPHKFDLGCAVPPTLVECKSHTWTEGGNAPSAKLTVWNEAMYYFACAPNEFRKILFVLRDERQGQTLAHHYVRRYGHLVPSGVEIWEYSPVTAAVAEIYRGPNG